MAQEYNYDILSAWANAKESSTVSAAAGGGRMK
jgi:hypothetical protein